MPRIYEIITNRILDKLEQGMVPWHKPWRVSGEWPQNLISQKPYHGINVFMLCSMGFASPFWLTFKQAKQLGGSVKKGEHGTPIIYWDWIKKEAESEEDVERAVPFCKYYTVFNIEQCDDLPADKLPKMPEQEETPFVPIELCEQVVEHMPQRPTINHREARAYYRPTLDYINMPRRETFESSEEYYSTIFHELTHSTGHESRLNRKGVLDLCPFGSTNYSKEELIAEMGAAFLCGHVGIEDKTLDNSASYISGWLKRLRDDKKMVIIAASQAEKAANFILAAHN